MDTKLQTQKILVITGDASFGERLTKKLSDVGYTVALSREGQEGFKNLVDTLPHLVIIDITVPGLDGYQILEKKAHEPLLASIPVFFMSTQGIPINMRKVPAGSVAEFIVAIQANLDEVVKKINNHFNYVPEVVEESKGKEKKILWVEDDKLIGNILGKKLLSSGFDVTHAKDGEEAVKDLEQIMPDAIMIDLLLPGMSGFDILQKVRNNPKFKDVPVMILSNLSKPSDIERAKILGAQKFLVKATASLDQIVMEVRNLCK